MRRARRGLAALLAAVLAAGLLLASPAGAETVYKYRRADGRTVYSNRPVRGLELIETFEYRFADPAPADKNAQKNAADADARIKQHLEALQAAWTEVQEASKALAAAEVRLRAGVEPQPGDRQGVASGGAAPAQGGAQTGRRGRASPEYVARMQGLENAVQAARTRLDDALRKYNQLR